jgi:hypothetical protein
MTADLAVHTRILIYAWLLARGVPPSCQEIATHFGVTRAEARDLLRRMGIGKTVLTHPATGEIWMAGPFSAIETPYRVVGRRTQWWANCAWDMFGVSVIAGEDVRIETQCTDCGDPWVLYASPHSKPADEGLVHFLLPARLWYADIGFT